MPLASLVASIVWALPFSAPEPGPQPIYGGEATKPGEFDAVVGLATRASLCTGTVVTPRLVLTAAHCLVGVPADSEVTVHFGTEVPSSQSVKAISWGAHPQFCGSSGCKHDIYDLGYVVVGQDILLTDYPAPITRQSDWDSSVYPGGEVTLVGFGESGEPAVPNAGLGTKRKVTTTIRSLTTGGLEFFAGGDGKDSCLGDSGGPAFVRLDNGTMRLAGILSRGSDPCGDGGYYGVPYAGLCWVRSETGVDLLPASCGACDCLDTTPDDEEGCRVDAGARRQHASWSVVIALLGLRLRRKRPDRPRF